MILPPSLPPQTHPLIHDFFSIAETFWNTDGFPYEAFRCCDTNKFRHNLVISPSWAWIFSTSGFYRNNEELPDEAFRHCETKKFSTENCNIRFSCLKFFDTQFFLKHRKVFISELFRYCDRKQFRQTILLPLPLLCIEISIKGFFSNTERFVYKVFCYGEIKDFQQKLVASRSYA